MAETERKLDQLPDAPKGDAGVPQPVPAPAPVVLPDPRVDKLIAENRSLAAEVQDIKRSVATQAKPKRLTVEEYTAMGLDPDQLEAGTAVLDAAGHLAGRQVAEAREDLTRQFREELEARDIAAFQRELSRQVPNWRAINATPQFGYWLQTNPGIKAQFDAATNALDAYTAGSVFAQFHQLMTAPLNPGGPIVIQQSVAPGQFNVPGPVDMYRAPAPAAPGSRGEPQLPRYRRSEVDAWMTHYRKLTARSPEDQKLLEELFRADNEGRVVAG